MDRKRMNDKSLHVPWGIPNWRAEQSRNEKYREIQVLHVLLEKEMIDHRFIPYLGGFQITWPYDSYPPEISAIEHDFSYGAKNDLIEVSVRGHIFTDQTAESTLAQIKYYMSELEETDGGR